MLISEIQTVLKPKKYTLGKKIGAGAFGSAYIITKKNTKHILKVIEKEDRSFNYDYNNMERHVLSYLSNPKLCNENVICAIDHWEDNKNIYIITTFAEGTDLYDFIKKQSCESFDKKELVILKLCQSLFYIHNIGIIHKDIKPENIRIGPFTNKKNQILADNFSVKYIDYGLSCLTHYASEFKNCAYNFGGTVLYIKPEAFLPINKVIDTYYNNDNNKEYNFGKHSDYWALGMTIYNVITGGNDFYFELLDIVNNSILESQNNPNSADRISIEWHKPILTMQTLRMILNTLALVNFMNDDDLSYSSGKYAILLKKSFMKLVSHYKLGALLDIDPNKRSLSNYIFENYRVLNNQKSPYAEEYINFYNKIKSSIPNLKSKKYKMVNPANKGLLHKIGFKGGNKSKKNIKRSYIKRSNKKRSNKKGSNKKGSNKK